MFLHSRQTVMLASRGWRSGRGHMTMLHLRGMVDLLVTGGGCSGRERLSLGPPASDLLLVCGLLGADPAQLWRPRWPPRSAGSVSGARRCLGMSVMSYMVSLATLLSVTTHLWHQFFIIISMNLWMFLPITRVYSTQITRDPTCHSTKPRPPADSTDATSFEVSLEVDRQLTGLKFCSGQNSSDVTDLLQT